MQYLELSDKATHVIKAGAGKLRGIVVTAAGTSWTAAIYDQTSAAVPTIATAFTLVAGFLNFGDVGFSNGLTIVTGGSTAGTCTVIYE